MPIFISFKEKTLGLRDYVFMLSEKEDRALIVGCLDPSARKKELKFRNLLYLEYNPPTLPWELQWILLNALSAEDINQLEGFAEKPFFKRDSFIISNWREVMEKCKSSLEEVAFDFQENITIKNVLKPFSAISRAGTKNPPDPLDLLAEAATLGENACKLRIPQPRIPPKNPSAPFKITPSSSTLLMKNGAFQPPSKVPSTLSSEDLFKQNLFSAVL